jgi:hypothetical protein
MIIWIGLIILLVIRILIRSLSFSILNLLILLAYIVALIGVIGKVRWGLWWIWGTSFSGIVVFFIFNDGLIYTLILDIVLLIIGIVAIFIEKEFTS